MLVLGFMMLIPVRDETFRDGRPTDGLRRIGDLLERSNARRGVTEPSGSYEVSCLLFVDLEPTPPRLTQAFPPRTSTLRVEQFLDKLLGLYNQRNQFVKL